MKKSSIRKINRKVGVLGGGQLGKMLTLAAANWHLPIYILDASKDFPAAPWCTHFQEGNFKDFKDVYRFGKTVDVLTIEIEHVNTDALQKLKEEGLEIHPDPEKLEIIKDKGRQKQFYSEHGLPTASFQFFQNGEDLRNAILSGPLKFPLVQKSRRAGYDGRGVAVIRNEDDLSKILPGTNLVEPLVDIEKELAVIAARRPGGEVVTFPAVEMAFNPEANLVEFLLCPARIDPAVEQKAEDLARSAIEAFDICGLLAVEMFLTRSGELLINEAAPRTHNSGHHTIDSCYTSQFEQHLRAILDLPLGSTRIKTPAVMVNLLGAEGQSGPPRYDGWEECLAMEGVKIHLYGKAFTRPFRKMGHATILDNDIEKALEKAKQVKKMLRILST